MKTCNRKVFTKKKKGNNQLHCSFFLFHFIFSSWCSLLKVQTYIRRMKFVKAPLLCSCCLELTLSFFFFVLFFFLWATTWSNTLSLYIYIYTRLYVHLCISWWSDYCVLFFFLEKKNKKEIGQSRSLFFVLVFSISFKWMWLPEESKTKILLS